MESYAVLSLIFTNRIFLQLEPMTTNS
uniref:Uncharacterized protein n=1 Tax=Rhizophora mucronata TaxID=61149 RepID=A0A2P2QZN7_RHIMU